MHRTRDGLIGLCPVEPFFLLLWMLGARMFKTLGCVILIRHGRAALIQRVCESFASRPLAGKPLVDWVVRRATEAERLDGVVVILSDRDDRTRFVERLVPADVRVFASGERDDLARVRECLEDVRIGGDRSHYGLIRRWWTLA